MNEEKVKQKSSPEINAGFFSKLFLLWVYPFLKQGSRKTLELSDVYQPLPENLSPKLGIIFEQKWKEEIDFAKKKTQTPKLWKVVVRIIWFPFACAGLGNIIDQLGFKLLQPIALRNFIKSFSTDTGNTAHYWNQGISASLLVLASFGHHFMFHKMYLNSAHQGMQCIVGLSSLIYQKILHLPNTDSEHTNVGKLYNLMYTDTRCFQKAFTNLHYIYISPILLCVYIYLLWDTLGVSSLLGIFGIFLLIPVQSSILRYSKQFRRQSTKHTDKRANFLHEIVGGIRLIKMYVWEKPFINKISQLRNNEVKCLKGCLYLRAMSYCLDTFTPKFIPFCALMLYVALDNTLTADKAFFAISIYQYISLTMVGRMSFGVSYLSEIISSLGRIEAFLLTENSLIKTNRHSLQKKRTEPDENQSKKRIRLENFSASWTEKQTTLRNLNIYVSGNKLVMVVGHVGSGKSSLLNAILGEMPTTTNNAEGHETFTINHVEGRISYATQEPWIFPASIRENILFGLQMQKHRYWEIVKLCCLEDDLKQLADGDRTLVGEKGTGLSGGQKARLSLARALYQDADVYLLDDPLSAVDAKVKHKLFHNCIQEHLKDKMRILVTHQLQYLPHADHIIVLDRDGSILCQGTYKSITDSKVDLSSLFGEQFMNTELDSYKKETKQAEADMVEIDSTKTNELRNRRKNKSETLTLKSVEPTGNNGNGKLALKEKKSGCARLETYLEYFKFGGSHPTMILIVMGFLAMHTLSNFSDHWLSLWTSSIVTQKCNTVDTKFPETLSAQPNNSTSEDFCEVGSSPSEENYYVFMYCVIMLSFILSCVFTSMLTFHYGMQISVNLHNKMLQSTIRAPVKFFDDNNSGVIMNRFVKDVYQTDEQLPRALFSFVNLLFMMCGIFVLNIATSSFILAPTLIFLTAAYKLRNFYLKTASSLKQMQSAAKSPMFTHVSTTVQGLTTIRALKAENRVFGQFNQIQDAHTSVYYLAIVTDRWFLMWLELMSVGFMAVVCFGFVFWSKSMSAGNVAVAVSSILSLLPSSSLQRGMKQSIEADNHMNCVKRIFEFCKLKSEAALETDEDKNLQGNWPNEGRIAFENVTMAYDKAKENPVLKNVSFSIEPQEKVGIVGRTGAGKSSLITALFRLTEISQGEITIDGVSIANLGLRTLRSQIAIIPQDPILFTESLRHNLDPFDEYSNEQLWDVLKYVDLFHAVDSLETLLVNGGANFSVGQKQLLCLARAMLRKNKILVLDEATANVDLATDYLVQQTIRTKFANCTVLTIAHRLQTVLDCDRIMVLDEGKVVEFDTPQALQNDNKSLFYSMAS